MSLILKIILNILESLIMGGGGGGDIEIDQESWMFVYMCGVEKCEIVRNRLDWRGQASERKRKMEE